MFWIKFKKYFSNCLTVCSHTLFQSSANSCGIHPAELSFFQIRFKLKCTLHNERLTALVTSRIVYLSSLSIVSLLYCCIVHTRLTADFAAYLTHFMIFLIRYLFITINFLKCRNNLHQRKTDFYISSYFFNFLNTFPNHFYKNCQRLAFFFKLP